MRIEVSVDDGHLLDLRVASLLDKYGLPGIFFIPTKAMRQLSEEQIKELSTRHEIGGHTENHPMDLKALPHPVLKSEIESNKQWLEGITGKDVTAFCYPRGRFNEAVKKTVQDAGFTWARTTKIFCLEKPTDMFEVDTAIHFFPGRSEYDGDTNLLKMVSDGLQLASSMPNGFFHLWLHSKEIEEHHLWEELEESLALMGEYNK